MQNLKQLRVSRSYTPEEVGAYVGKSRKSIEDYENGFAHRMSFHTAVLMAEMYEIPVEDLAKTVFPSHQENK